MSEASPPPPAKTRWSSGFVWGCLTPLIVLAVLFTAVMVYSGYFLVHGFRNDSSFQTVIAAVQNNPLAQDILGKSIKADGASSYSYEITNGRKHATFRFDVSGSKASGTVDATLDSRNGKDAITELLLTGPDGVRHDLLTEQPKGQTEI